MSHFRYAICNETFKDWEHGRAFAYAKELGYTGIEIAPFTLNPDCRQITTQQRQEIRELAETHGLEVIGLHWLLAFTEDFYLTSPDADIRQATSEYLVELGRLCQDIGGSVMVLGSPKQRNLLTGVSHDQALGYATEVLQRACDRFGDWGVTLAVEPLGPEEGDFLLTAESGLELVDRVARPNCGLHLDVKAMSSESKSIQAIIRNCIDRTVHFHANDPNRRGPGMGELDFVPILQSLRDSDYQGWVSVEVFDYEPGVEALATESLRNLQAAEAQVS